MLILYNIGLKFVKLFIIDVSCKSGNGIGITKNLFYDVSENLTKLISEKNLFLFRVMENENSISCYL